MGVGGALKEGEGGGGGGVGALKEGTVWGWGGGHKKVISQGGEGHPSN